MCLDVSVSEHNIYGCAFQVESDHKPLEMINLKNLTATPARLQRMLLRLQAYDITIVYHSDKEMTLVDGFSRLPSKRVRESIDLDNKVDFLQFSAQKLAQIQ